MQEEENRIKRGYEILRELKDELLKDHEQDMIFIDCRTGNYTIQGDAETRSAAEKRFFKMYPDAELFLEQIVSDDFVHQMPTMTTVVQNGQAN